MKKVYLVGASDCESNSTVCICATKKIEERELFKKRDELIAEWKEMDKFIKEGEIKNNFPDNHDEMYLKMIKNLSSDDYKNWDNFPHEEPYISEINIIDKEDKLFEEKHKKGEK